MRRGMTVLKMRGSAHDKAIREFTIDGAGVHVHEPFHTTSGILQGVPVHMSAAEIRDEEEEARSRRLRGGTP